VFFLFENKEIYCQSLDENLIDENNYCADLGNGYYQNPILKGDYGDPSVLRVGEDYYMTNHMATMSIPQLLIWHSKDLVNWEPLCYALNEDLGGAVWAVDFIKYKDLFYIYMPVPAKNTNYVITAKNPMGPWSKPVDLKVSGIDPGHIATPDGKRYLHVDNGYMVELSKDGLSAKTDKKRVYEGWQYPKDWIVECFCLESPKLTYHNNYYYLTVAQGGTSGPPTSHMVVSARSKTPFGSWENSPYNPIVRNTNRNNKWSSTGHGTLVDSPDGKWWIIFHGYESGVRSMGRQTLMLPVEWTEDNWYRIPDGIDVAAPIKKPAGVKVQNRMRLSDDFSGDSPGIQWKLLQSNINDRVIIKDQSLVMISEGNTPRDSRPLLIDPMSNFYMVEVGVSSSDTSKGGLLLYNNIEKYLGLELDNNSIYHMTGNGNREFVLKTNPDDTIRFKLINDHHDLLYYYSKDNGNNWTRIDFVNNLLDMGGGTLRPGLYASGVGDVSFFNFLYRGVE